MSLWPLALAIQDSFQFFIYIMQFHVFMAFYTMYLLPPSPPVPWTPHHPSWVWPNSVFPLKLVLISASNGDHGILGVMAVFCNSPSILSQRFFLNTCLFLSCGPTDVRAHSVYVYVCTQACIFSSQNLRHQEINDGELVKSLIYYFLYKILVTVFTCLTGVS